MGTIKQWGVRAWRIAAEVGRQLYLAAAGAIVGAIFAWGYSWGDAERDKWLGAMVGWACLWISVGGIFAGRSLDAQLRAANAERDLAWERSRVARLEREGEALCERLRVLKRRDDGRG